MRTTTNRTGPLLEAMRSDRGWTRDRMADEILQHPELGPLYSVCPKSIYRAERGMRPTVRVRFAIATVLGTTSSHLWPPPTTAARRPMVSA